LYRCDDGYGTLCLVQVDGMDVLAVKQACKFAKQHALENGPIVSEFPDCHFDCAHYGHFWISQGLGCAEIHCW
jgi:hypothetical protein